MPTLPQEEILVTNPGDLPIASSITDDDIFVIVKSGVAHQASGALVKLFAGTGSGLPALSAPTITVTVLSASSLRVNIGAVADETGFEVQRSNDGTSGWATIATPGANAAQYVDTGLPASTQRFYRVRAIANPATHQNSPYSNVASGTTQAGSSYEAETLTFEAGLGAVGSGWSLTEKDATNTLVVTAKSIGWSKFQAIHIYVGSNLPGAYLNLVNPNNSNAAFRLTPSGAAPTLSNGLQMGATSVLDTNFNYATNFASLNSVHFGFAYSGASGEATAGVKDGTFGDAGIIIGGNYGGNNVLASQGGKQYFSTGIGLAAGRLSLSRTAAGDSNARLLYNGTVLNAFSSAGGFTANGTITYGSVRNLLTNAQDNAGAHKLTIGYIGTGLTPSEQDTWDTAVQTFLTALGR